MLLYVVCLFKNMSYKWTKMKKLVMYIYLAYFNIMKGVNMKKNNFKKNSFLPKTGDIPSSEVPIVAGLGLIIGLLGNRKFNR